jgi:hypothetical protein
MFTVLLNTLSTALELWNNEEKTKYIDEKMSIQKAWYAEYNKDPALRNDAVLDNLEFRLRVLATAFCTSVGKQDAPAKS